MFVYTFLIKVTDDFCPAPAITIATISVEVLAVPTDQPPDIRCVSVDVNGDVLLSWEHLSAAQSSTIYNVYSSTSPNGPFNLLDTLGYPTDTYIHSGAGADAASIYYYMTSESDCAGVSAASRFVLLALPPVPASPLIPCMKVHSTRCWTTGTLRTTRTWMTNGNFCREPFGEQRTRS